RFSRDWSSDVCSSDLAKNLATKAMVAALLGGTESVLRDVPVISDVQVVRSLLEVHGVTVVEDGEGVLRLDPSGAESAHMEEIDEIGRASCRERVEMTV